MNDSKSVDLRVQGSQKKKISGSKNPRISRLKDFIIIQKYSRSKIIHELTF